jgi:propionyl-CoA carboxylase alpha chain
MSGAGGGLVTAPLPRRVLIANRGEIAVRIARTCRALGVGTVAVFSDVDEGSLHVRTCDQAVRLGGAAPADSYLRIEAVLAAAVRSGADAVHPGYGFLAENADFARAVVAAGLTWIGPTAEVIATMGDKVAAKRAMAAAGVPLVPGSELPDGADVHAAADGVGYPVLVKAAAGGGGKGMRVVTERAGLADAVAAARREADGAFGDATVFLERYVERSRHVEVQILGDTHGHVVHAFERECSVQRRHQKVLEEAPSPGIDEEVRAAVCAAAVDAARAIGYVGAGTVEFIADEARLAARRGGEDLDPSTCFAFLEVNTRLQVEHPVTEATVRHRDAVGELHPLDLVREQLRVAAGQPLGYDQQQLVRTGHAVEARLYAEDPAAGYLPRSGPLHVLRPAGGPGVRWDAGVTSGDVISTHYDPMVAKVIASGPTRDEAAARLARALDETVVIGPPTNRDLLVDVLRAPAFLAGATTTSYLDDHHGDERSRRSGSTPAAVRLAATAATLAAAVGQHSAAVVPTVRHGFVNAGTFAPTVTFELDDGDHRVAHRQLRDGTWEVTHAPEDPAPGVDVAAEATGTDHVRVHAAQRHAADDATTTRIDLEVAGHRTPVTVVEHGGIHAVASPFGRVELRVRPRFPDRTEALAEGATVAPMPGSVVMVAVAIGQRVERGALLCTVEAMKMEHRVTAPVAGSVTEVRVATGDQVDAEQVLVIVTEHGAGGDAG